jgi:hypothetical protein
MWSLQWNRKGEVQAVTSIRVGDKTYQLNPNDTLVPSHKLRVLVADVYLTIHWEDGEDMVKQIGSIELDI